MDGKGAISVGGNDTVKMDLRMTGHRACLDVESIGCLVATMSVDGKHLVDSKTDVDCELGPCAGIVSGDASIPWHDPQLGMRHHTVRIQDKVVGSITHANGMKTGAMNMRMKTYDAAVLTDATGGFGPIGSTDEAKTHKCASLDIETVVGTSSFGSNSVEYEIDTHTGGMHITAVNSQGGDGDGIAMPELSDLITVKADVLGIAIGALCGMVATIAWGGGPIDTAIANASCESITKNMSLQHKSDQMKAMDAYKLSDMLNQHPGQFDTTCMKSGCSTILPL